jgi:hypothetical protein
MVQVALVKAVLKAVRKVVTFHLAYMKWNLKYMHFVFKIYLDLWEMAIKKCEH